MKMQFPRIKYFKIAQKLAWWPILFLHICDYFDSPKETNLKPFSTLEVKNGTSVFKLMGHCIGSKAACTYYSDANGNTVQSLLYVQIVSKKTEISLNDN